MSITKHLIIWGLCMAGCALEPAFAGDSFVAGPLFSDFPTTLQPGDRTEILGPIFYSERQDEGQHQWGVPPLGLSYTRNPQLESEEFDLAYPVLTYDRFGKEYRWQFFQMLNFAGGQVPGLGDEHRFTIFPIYFQQRSTIPGHNYTAVVPFYGHLQDRLFRNEIDFVMLPFYVKSRRADVVTWNMPWPFFDIRRGNGLAGWAAWPFVGREHKEVTTVTNGFGDAERIAGHDSLFVLWPFFSRMSDGIGTDNPSHESALLPFYDYYRSPQRDSTSYLWPFGVTHVIDRTNRYEEWDAPWPLVEFAHGEGKTTHRIWPFFSRSHNQYLQDDWYAWPIWWTKRATAVPLDYRRTRILMFLYDSITEKNTETGQALERQDFWPLYTHEHQPSGNDRLQVLSLFEPLFPASKSIARDYSPLCAIWRSERNPKAGLASDSFLWNLYRRDAGPQAKNISLLFGLFQYQSSPEGARWRILYLPAFGARTKPAPPARPAG